MSAVSKREIEHFLASKKANSFILVDDKEIYKMDDMVKVTHYLPITKSKLHDVEFLTYDLMNTTVLCPICDPLSDHENGVENLHKLLKKRKDVYRIEQDVVDVEGQLLDFLINNRYVIHYVDVTYFKNFTIKTEELLEIEKEFEEEEDFIFIPVTYKDMLNIESFLEKLTFDE